MNGRRHVTLLCAAVLGFSACGGGADDTGSPSPDATESANVSTSGTPSEGGPQEASSTDAADATEDVGAEPQPTTGAPAEPQATESSTSSTAPDSTEPTVVAATDPEPPTDPTPAAEPEAESAPPEIGGRDLGEALDADADFASNPLPDLVVADVGRDAKVNLRNVLPSDRPVLVWAWAPH